MRPDQAAWVRAHVARRRWHSTHVWGGCDPATAVACWPCTKDFHQHCAHGRPLAETELYTGKGYVPAGCRLPEVPAPRAVWLSDRACRTHCGCPCRTTTVLRDDRGAPLTVPDGALF
ncbi:hypothetical protein CLV63_1555 [Murinocardiopsis flavida]|uniref:Uncharacterized protein n=1 Tax=Murinocardiopsis flavida TaxID=645275 RepID=A0A2P8C685_9ACTN|nr:hypothetical protein [Murinocardiopsis flavida]PSK80457.1 hypothetical protein CLV63_1555 [Murinocardiopsis flavida]